mmetsp:Transcript_41253/g.132874  ORF Transcript_41253/g.132874 Transcript_41253/m.132874 type:complete len:663 (+) Transcript_41253:1-1989(+)
MSSLRAASSCVKGEGSVVSVTIPGLPALFTMVAGGCCGGCFAGVGGKFAPDVAPSIGGGIQAASGGVAVSNEKVGTMQEAMKLQRPAEGTFLPSPPTLRRTDSPGWASPAPYGSVAMGTDIDCDFDLVMEELDQAAGSLGCQMDLDAPGRATAKTLMTQRSKYEAEQILGSPGTLPMPMSADEREAVIRSILPTATFQMLSKIPPQLLTKASDDAQALRRKMAHGATIVFVSAGLPGKRFTFERAAALGLKVVILEHPDSWSSSLVKEGIVAKFLPVDMSQGSEAVFAQAMALIGELGKDGLTGTADGIATFVELSVPLVSRLAERLGLPGHRPAAVDAARNKHSTRARLKEAGLPTPRNVLLKSVADLERGSREVGFPAVLKPASGAASLGVKKVENEQDMLETYNEIIEELSTLVVTSGALVKGTPNSGGVDASKIMDMSVLMEQYLDGCEVDIDVVMSGGEYQYAAVADNGPTMEPYFNETWAVCPSLLPKDTQRQLKELGIACVKALGFTSGVFHVECKMTSTGPQLIEVNARMGGGQVFECNLRAWGVDLVEETLFAALGIPSAPPVPKQPLSAVAYCYVNAPVSGRVDDLSQLEGLMKREGVVWAKPLVKPGTQVTGPEKGMPSWLCDLFVTRPTAREALDFLKSLEAENPVPVVV